MPRRRERGDAVRWPLTCPPDVEHRHQVRCARQEVRPWLRPQDGRRRLVGFRLGLDQGVRGLRGRRGGRGGGGRQSREHLDRVVSTSDKDRLAATVGEGEVRGRDYCVGWLGLLVAGLCAVVVWL